MKTSAVKGLFAAAAAVLFTATPLVGRSVTIDVDQIKQRYPWNGLVDIDYTITLGQDEAFGVDDSLEVLMIDRAITPAVTNRAITFLQAPLPLTAGAHRITWDANADDVTNRTDNAEFVVRLRHYSEAYMVIDVSVGAGDIGIYTVDFLNGTPDGGFNVDEYKGDKIVLRRIHPGSYMAGSPENEANRQPTATLEKQHRVAISKPFYIGLFEITQQQYLNVMGSNPSQYKDGDKDGKNGQYRPVEMVSWDTVRGGSWPNGKPGSDSFMDKLISKCKSKDPSTGEYTVKVGGFDLPTEFQWEYACRAGTTNAFNITYPFDNASPSDQEAQLKLLGRYTDNQSEGQGGITTAHTIVGSYRSNAWGLYDMHGNVLELCLDWVIKDPMTLNPKQYKDPPGAASGSYRLTKGGSWGNVVGGCRSAYRDSYRTPSAADGYVGFRLIRTLP